MSPIERLRWASAPVQHRSIALLWGGLAAFTASGGVLASMDAPPLVGAVLYLVMVTGWVAGACGAVGYVRWYFGQAAAEARKQHSLDQKE
jgi:hypothetical protein